MKNIPTNVSQDKIYSYDKKFRQIAIGTNWCIFYILLSISSEDVIEDHANES